MKFLYEGEAPARPIAVTKWIKTNLNLQWPIQDIIQPATTTAPRQHVLSQQL